MPEALLKKFSIKSSISANAVCIQNVYKRNLLACFSTMGAILEKNKDVGSSHAGN
jgi:hypothetical protein